MIKKPFFLLLFFVLAGTFTVSAFDGVIITVDGSTDLWDLLDTPADINLSDLGDVNATSPGDGEVLVYNASTNSWASGPAGSGVGDITSVTAGNGLSGGGTSGGVTLSILGSACSAGEVTKYNGTTFTCVTLSGGGDFSFTDFQSSFDSNYTAGIWSYNQTTAVGDYNYNQSDGSFNSTYDQFAYNQSDGNDENSTWNEIRANTLYSPIIYGYNMTLGVSGDYNYNQTGLEDTTYHYNQSDGSYNATYDIYAYNMSDGVGSGGNASWNQTYADLLYSPIIWAYNQSQSIWHYNQTVSNGLFNFYLNSADDDPGDGYNVTDDGFISFQDDEHYLVHSRSSNEITYSLDESELNTTVDDRITRSIYYYNQTIGVSGDYNYNQTGLEDTTYHYNQSDGSYNVSYAPFAYNQTTSSSTDTRAATVIVSTQNDDGDYTDIQTAINSLPTSGGIVHIKNGTYTLSSAITIDSNFVILQGEGPASRINFDGSTIPIAIQTNGAVNGIQIRDLRIDTTSTDNGLAINASLSAAGKFENLWITDVRQGILLHGTGTHYNTIENLRVDVGGTGSYGINISNAANDNTVLRTRIITSTDSTGVFVDAHAIHLYSVNVETNAAFGVDVGGNADDVYIGNVYLEGNDVNLRINNPAEATTIVGGFIADGDSNNIIDNGLGTTYINPRVQYEPYGINTSNNVSANSFLGDGRHLTNIPLITNPLYADIIWGYNQTIAGSGDNASWNEIHADTQYSSIIWNYNESDGSYNSTYEQYSYNMSDGSYNNTYDTFAYNQTIASGDYNYNQSDGSYNGTYNTYAYNMSDGNDENSTWNEILADTLYSPIIWAYNQTTGGSFGPSDFQSAFNTNYTNAQWSYNQSDGSYNATYDIYAYNQTSLGGGSADGTGGWTNTSVETNTTLNVNVNANITTTDRVCLNAACTSYLMNNGTTTILK